MSADRLGAAVERAIQEGLLPAGTAAAAHDDRPWPVVLLIALGAWLAALPLLAAVAMLLGDVLRQGAGLYLIGTLMLAGAWVVLRSRDVPVFVEQLSLPALMVGLSALGIGVFRDLGQSSGAAVMTAACLALAASVPRPWLRVLLGAAAGVLCGVAGSPGLHWAGSPGDPARLWLALHTMLGIGLVATALRSRLPPQWRAALESTLAGWLLATLAGLAWWSGMTMLVGANLGGGIGGELAGRPWNMARLQSMPMQIGSLLLSLAASAWTARQWPPLRQGWCAAAAAVLAALAYFMPSLGATLLTLAVTATTTRWRLAGTAALAAAWIVGAFYYALAWPLQLKALVLLGAGAAMGAIVFWAWRASHRQPGLEAPASQAPSRRDRAGLALSMAAVLIAANGGIWQKETLIETGRPLFVELAPVDPRSLMQGDFMALRFALPVPAEPPPGLLQPTRPTLAARPDARGVATLRLLAPGATPAPGELLIELTPKNGRWVLVTDAWFFAEGEAARWAAARYGEFRVDSHGRALLVGLRGAALQAL